MSFCFVFSSLAFWFRCRVAYTGDFSNLPGDLIVGVPTHLHDTLLSLADTLPTAVRFSEIVARLFVHTQYFTFLPVIFHLLFLHVVSLIVFVFCFWCFRDLDVDVHVPTALPCLDVNVSMWSQFAWPMNRMQHRLEWIKWELKPRMNDYSRTTQRILFGILREKKPHIQGRRVWMLQTS